LALNFVQTANRVQCLFWQLTFIRHVQIEKLAAGVGHATDFDHALAKRAAYFEWVGFMERLRRKLHGLARCAFFVKSKIWLMRG
jgi:hypothetical protein